MTCSFCLYVVPTLCRVMLYPLSFWHDLCDGSPILFGVLPGCFVITPTLTVLLLVIIPFS